MKEQHLVYWFRQMAVLLNCGIPPLSALAVCERQTSCPTIRKACQDISVEVRMGQRLSHAMRLVGPPFEPLHYGAVEIGESHGDLPLVFERLASHAEEVTRVKRRLLSALAYPLLVIIISALGLYLLVRFLAPVLAEVGEQLGEEPSAVSEVMLFLGSVFENELLTLGGLIGLFFLTKTVVRYLWTHHRVPLEKVLMAAPLLGKMLRLSILIRICQTLETMLGGGLAVTESFRLAAKTCGSEYYAQNVLLPAVDRIRLGESMCHSLRGCPGVPASFYGLLVAGEETGSLDLSFKYLSQLYEMELVTAVEAFLSALEPLAISFVGLVVLGVLLSVFMPLSRLVTSV